jgi:hypothetical protein
MKQILTIFPADIAEMSENPTGCVAARAEA